MARTFIFSLLVAALALTGCGSDHQGPQPDPTVTFLVHVPPATPSGSAIYLASSLGGWDPAPPAALLTEVSPLVYRLALTLPVGTALAYKFTRGSWATIEKGDGGVEVPNREYLVTGTATLELTVLTWADML